MNTPQFSRRTVLTGSAVLAAASFAELHGLSSSASAAERRPDPVPEPRRNPVMTGRPSVNGWEMELAANDNGHVYDRPVPGTPLAGVAVRMGEVEAVLVHVIRRFHYEVDTLLKGDVIGWRSPNSVHTRRAESNQASGTAVQIRPGHYPAGARGGFFPNQMLVIRDVLAELDGVVRWGGDDRRPDEALFSIDVEPGDPRLTEVAHTLREWRYTPGEGAGSGVNVLSPARRKDAEQLARRQKRE